MGVTLESHLHVHAEEPWSTEFHGSSLVVGAGTAERIAAIVKRRGYRHTLLVTDAGLVDAGHVEAVQPLLEREGVRVTCFADVLENPDEATCARGGELARSAGVDAIVALGGGSVLDAAKGVNLVATQGGRLRDYQGRTVLRQPTLPSIALPSTAGTGSDAQTYALISHDETHEKMACGADGLRFADVILDPRLMATAPTRVVSIAAMDALSHAIEAFATKTRQPLSMLYARESWRLLTWHWDVIAGESIGNDEIRTELLWASHLAGAAIEQSMLGAAHGCANPLTARYGITHGIAVGLLLPHVVRFNAALEPDPYEALDARGGIAMAMVLEHDRNRADLPAHLRDCGVPRDVLPELAQQAVGQWTAQHNPRPLGVQEALELYEAAY